MANQNASYYIYVGRQVWCIKLSLGIPGNCNIDGENDDWDFGTGAGFYVDATEEKWKKHYRMYSYITKEVRNKVGHIYSIFRLNSFLRCVFTHA